MADLSHVLHSKDLIYKSYHQSRGEGFSGSLLIASDTRNPTRRYIVKAAMAHVAACEFMYYRLASSLKLPVARVWFISSEKLNEFSYPACAIRYIPNAVALKYDEYMQIEDCRLLTDLSFILGDRDNQDFLRDESGASYKIDHSDCFCIEGTAESWINPAKATIELMIYQMARPKPYIGHYAEKSETRSMLKSIARMRLSDFADDFRLISQFCGVSFEEHFRFYISELIEQCRAVK